MQYAGDEALADALAARVRDLRGLLEFDWDRDGRFAHPYSNLSTLMVSATDERQLTGDLPDEVSTLTGYASSELTVTLEGARHADEYSAHQLFSRYFAPSPLAQLLVTGTPVRYSRIVGTADGERVIRQFTGWVRSAPVDYEAGTVTIQALDNLNIAGKLVTLPRFAVTESDDAATHRPFSSTWVIEETLRQAGRPTIPVPRSDAVVYVSCNGSFIPSFGYGTFADGKTNLLYNHFISYANSEAWQDGKHGLAPVRNTGGTSLAGRNGSSFNAQYQLNPAPISASGTPSTLSVAAWVYANGTTGAHNNKNNPYFHTHYHLETVQFVDQSLGAFTYDAGCTLEVFQDGSVRAQTVEASNASGGARRWIFDRTTALSAGWHYLAVEFRFQWNDVTSGLRVDDALVNYTGSQESTGGYRYTTPMNESRENWVNLIANIPAQHLQWWYVENSLSGQYQPGQGEPPLTVDEHPLSRVDRTLSEMTWIPDITNTSAWTVLQNVANAEFGVVTIDEWGTVQTLSHDTARQITSQSTADAVTITDDHLFGMLLNTDEDHYRNTISLSYTDRTAVRGTVYTPNDVFQFEHIFSTWAPSYWTFPDAEIGDDVISVYPGSPDRIGPDSDAKDNIIRGSAAARGAVATAFWFYDTSFTYLGVGYWAFFALPYPDQRRITAQSGYQTALVPIRVVFANDDSLTSSSIKLAGTKYGESSTTRLLVDDAEEVAAQGTRMVELADNTWRQSEGTARAIATSLLGDTLVPVPTISGVKLPCDPRRQIRDVIIIQSETGKMGRVYTQIIGITRSDSESDSTDELTLRVVDTPGGWRLGDPDLSILGSTTVL